MKAIIKYDVEVDGYFKRYSNEIECFGFHQELVNDIERAIELFKLRQDAYRSRWKLPELEQS